jgi:hypothetical protein
MTIWLHMPGNSTKSPLKDVSCVSGEPPYHFTYSHWDSPGEQTKAEAVFAAYFYKPRHT